MNDIIQTITVYAIPVIFAITLHEAAHGYVAKHFGDATAFVQGRVTLNPLKHIDPIGTIVIPIVLAILTAGKFVFGYAKPVPVSFGNLRNPRRHMIWVALAGPVANLIQALLWSIFGVVIVLLAVQEPYFYAVVNAGVLVNLVMFALNLFPVPPLDGGRVLAGILPMRLAVPYSRIEPYGFFIVLALVATGLLNVWMLPIMGAMQALFAAMIRPFL
ncbi:MAG: site-2 protease family protein [Burkholderiaceae bacterium]